MDEQIELAKRQLRRSIRQQRQNQQRQEQAKSRELLAQNALKLFARLPNATQISCYISAKNEPDTSEILKQFHHRNIPILLPVSQPDKTLAWQFYHPELEIIERSRMPEPQSYVPGLRPSGETLMLIPAAASDRSGNRLGWGGGYYDRTLAITPRNAGVYAVLNDNELMRTVPVLSHDHPITGALTPSHIHHVNPEIAP